MIIGLGTDIVKISRIREVYEKRGEKFVDKILSDKEKERFCDIKDIHKVTYLAKRFTAKEAFVKATGVGFNKDFSFKALSVMNDKMGKPYYDIDSSLQVIIKDLFDVSDFHMHLSISDDEDYANAVAILENVTSRS